MPSEGRHLTVMAVCYNHARFLTECLDSIRAQTFQDFQLVITDDGSTDGSPALIREWLTAHGVSAHFIRHETNRGLCPTLNEALAAVRGKYLAKISTDDVWMPYKLARQVPVMESLSDRVAVLYGDALQINEAGQVLPRKFLSECAVSGPGPSGNVFRSLLRRNFVLGPTTLVRTECLRSVGGYDETLAYEDWDMWLRLARRYEFQFSPEIFTKYRIVKSSLSRTTVAWGSPNQLWTDLRILEKCLDSPDLSRAEAARTRLRMLACALRLARHAEGRAVQAVGRALGAWH
jgi:glycosyltransferase involved in cell wall biosynthesis